MTKDYCIDAIESFLETQKLYQIMELKGLKEESEFIRESLDLGYIVLKEPNMEPTTEAIALIAAIILFFDKIASLFREKAIERSKKYSGWLEDYADDLKEKCKSLPAQELAPLWRGKWEQDGNNLVSAVRTAYTNYKSGKYDDYGFVNSFLSNVKILTEKDGDLAGNLKNYFRFNVKGIDRPKDMVMTGEALANEIDDMIKYNLEFLKGPAARTDKIHTEIANQLKNVNPPEGTKTISAADANAQNNDNQNGTKEGFSANAWLSIEDRPVCESMLTTLSNYTILTEAKRGKNKSSSRLDTKEAEQEKAKKAEKENGSVTQVNDDGDNKTDNTTQNNDTANTNTSENAKTYFNNCETFFKMAISAYQTALDERYLLYHNLFLKIATNGGISKPTFDRNGNYIRRSEIDENNTKVKDKTDDVDKTDTTKVNDKPQKKGIKSGLKAKGDEIFNKVSGGAAKGGTS